MIKETSAGHKNSKKNLLIISYPFPPIPYSGTYRIIRMCKGLAKLGVEVHALSIKVDERIPNDYDLIGLLPDAVTVHRTPIIDPWLRYQNWKKKGINGLYCKFLNKIFSASLSFITIPDHQILWIPFAVYRGLKIIRKHQIQTVLVTSPPVSSLLAGVLLKKIARVKFIADLRDPIVGNIAQVNLIQPTDFRSKLEKRMLVNLERLIVKNADKVITNTKAHCEQMVRKYNKEFPTVRNAFDPDDYKTINKEKYDKFTISHLGGIYGLRNADVLLSAIKILEGHLSPNSLNLQVLFIGSVNHNFEQSIRKLGVQKYVKLVSPVPHKKAIEIMVKSHLLLVVKAKGAGSYGQIPAKFYEYLGAGSGILYLGPKKSELSEIIQKLRVGFVIEDEERNLVNILKDAYIRYSSRYTKPIMYSVPDEFKLDYMSKQIAELISG